MTFKSLDPPLHPAHCGLGTYIPDSSYGFNGYRLLFFSAAPRADELDLSRARVDLSLLNLPQLLLAHGLHLVRLRYLSKPKVSYKRHIYTRIRRARKRNNHVRTRGRTKPSRASPSRRQGCSRRGQDKAAKGPHGCCIYMCTQNRSQRFLRPQPARCIKQNSTYVKSWWGAGTTSKARKSAVTPTVGGCSRSGAFLVTMLETVKRNYFWCSSGTKVINP